MSAFKLVTGALICMKSELTTFELLNFRHKKTSLMLA